MDWLEEFISPDQDVHQLAELLQTPGKLNETMAASASVASTASSTSSPMPPLSRCDSPPSTPKSSNRKKRSQGESHQKSFVQSMLPQQLFKDNSSGGSASQQHEKTNTSSTSNPSSRRKGSSSTGLHTKQHSLLTLGNGWNAKGLKKARQGLWKDALACWDVALELRLPILSATSEEVANTYNNRGIALGKLGEYPQALESLNKALEIRLYNNNQNNKGGSSSSAGNNASSNNSNTKKKTATSVIISTYHNIANVHQQSGDYNKALAIFGLAKALCYEEEGGRERDDYPSMVSMARLCTAMGHVYYQAEQWVDARDAYYDAIWVYQQIVREHKDHETELQELRKDIREVDQKIVIAARANASSSATGI